MSFRDKAKRLQKIATSPNFIGEALDSISYRPQSGGVFSIPGIFFEDFQATETDSGTEFSGTVANFEIELSSLSNPPLRNDEIRFDGKIYKVYDIHPDGLGMATLFVHLKSD